MQPKDCIHSVHHVISWYFTHFFTPSHQQTTNITVTRTSRDAKLPPDWIEQGLTTPPTQYRLSGRQFYRSKDPTNSIKVLKEKLASHRPEEAQNPPGASHCVTSDPTTPVQCRHFWTFLPFWLFYYYTLFILWRRIQHNNTTPLVRMHFSGTSLLGKQG